MRELLVMRYARPRKLAQATDASHLEASPSPIGLRHSARPWRSLGFFLRIVALRKTRKRPIGRHENARFAGFTNTPWVNGLFADTCGAFVAFCVGRSPLSCRGGATSPKGECDDWLWRCRKASGQKANRRIPIAQAIVATLRFRGRA